jgi:hypothetical protein
VSQADMSGVLAKVERAKTHLRNFDIEADRIRMAYRNAITQAYDEQQSEYVIRLNHVPTVPDVLSLTIGDAVHNLRASLDYLAWQLVIAADSSPTRETSFPIRKRPSMSGVGIESLPDIKPGVPQELREILDRVQPYKRENPASHELAILSWLDNSDKHRELLIAIVAAESAAWWGDIEPHGLNPGPYHDGDDVFRFTIPGAHGQTNINPALLFTVRFNEPGLGAWRFLDASGLVYRSLRYVEDKVLPPFQRFF